VRLRECENGGVSECAFTNARGLDNKGFALLRPKVPSAGQAFANGEALTSFGPPFGLP
jgi:hypothetical protein